MLITCRDCSPVYTRPRPTTMPRHTPKSRIAGPPRPAFSFLLLNYFEKRVLWCHTNKRAISSVGRAVRLHRKGQEFESLIAHEYKKAGFIPVFLVLGCALETRRKRVYRQERSEDDSSAGVE